MTKVPAFYDIGKASRELLYGSKVGVFQYNQLLTVSTKTADGVEFTATAVKKDDHIDAVLKSAYKTPQWGLAGAFTSAGTVTATASLTNLAAGLDVTLTGTVPEVSSAKLGLDYAIPHLTAKSTVSLTSQPKVDLAVTTGHGDIVCGGETSFDTAKNTITRWSVGAGYVQRDYSVGVLLKDLGKVLTVSYAHNIDPTSSVGAEVTKKLEEKEATVFALGYAKRLDSGALAKARLDNTGIASLLYETELKPLTKLALSSQFDATDLSKAPKFGLALDVKN
ncbi:hypothetical protein WJX81_007295 [Elliptochloris bilobata]|uniref:Uncharacterized protein n=1 Tax=Elliptochloris bilobata TaxID=381761 RepID=A0AAW1R4J1_9CHLO